jgi:hypothetical protein
VVRWGTWCGGAASSRCLGGLPTVVELEGQVWVFGPNLDPTGHDLDAWQSSIAPGWPGCAWLAYQRGNVDDGPATIWGWPG